MRLEKLKIFDSRLAGQSQLALTAGWRRVQAGKLLFSAGLQWLCGGAAGRLQCSGSAVHAKPKLAGGGEWPPARVGF